jgi:ketosteroid isomerase-like protein
VDGDRDSRSATAPRGAGRRAERRSISWPGVDVFSIRDGRILRKDVYSDSVAILRAVGLLA